MAGLALALVTPWALDYAERWQPDGTLAATIWRGGDDTPVLTTDTRAFDPASLAAEAGLDPRQPFTVEWRGLLVVEEAGIHRLRVRVDDGVAAWVGEAPVIDEADQLGQTELMGHIQLAPGLHPFRLRYVQRGGDSLLRVSWSKPSWREQYEPLLLTAETEPPPLVRRIAKARAYPRQVATLWAVWIVLGLTLAGARLLGWLEGRPVLAALPAREVAALALLALPLLAASIDVGVQPWRGWAPDEVQPRDVIGAVSSAFTGGWYHLYPPLPFYVLGLVNAPFALLTGTGALSYDDPPVLVAMHTVSRGVSLALAWLTLLGVALLGGRTAGPRARLWAPLVLAGIPLFPFYARTANVDMAYAFWVCVAALALWNAVERRTLRDHVALGAVAAAAVASKDQAYGYFPGAALLLLWMAWRDTAGDTWPRRLTRTVGDRQLWAGLVTCLALYSVLVGAWWNLDGVRAHVALITGQASVPFRMFPATLDGHARLALTTAGLLGQAVGPVVLATATLGLGLAVSARGGPASWGLGLMAVGYVVTFVGVVGYVYDRFLLVALVPVALLAARGTAWLLDHVSHGRVRVALALALLAAYVAPGTLLAWRQLTDTRHDAETWMVEHLLDDPLVLGVGTALYLPNLHPFQHRLVQSGWVADLLTWAPGAIVINSDWLERPDQPPLSMVAHDLAAAGFEEAYTTARTPAGGPPGAVLATSLRIDPVYSNLSKLSPPLSIWVRRAAPALPAEPIPVVTAPDRLTGAIVFQSDREGRSKLFRVDLATGAVTPLTAGPDHRDESPAVSPDGTRVAFATTRFDAATYDIAVMGLADGDVHRWTSDPAFERQPAWTPDGQGLLFSSLKEGTEAVFRLAFDGQTPWRVSPPPDRAAQADVSPDGRRLAFTQGAGDGLRIAVHDGGSGRPRLISSGPGDTARPRWSPDGRRLAYTRLSSAGSSIEVADVDGGTTRRIALEGLAAVADPDWSADGGWLVVSATKALGDGENWDLYLVRVGGEASAHRLTSGRGHDREPAWVPR